MKKRILIGLVISIAIWGYFYPNREDDEVRKKSVEIQKIIKPDKNITVVTEQKINQPPTVDAGVDQNITFGDEVRLEAIAKDSDGEILSYLWREGNRTLSEEERFDYKFDKGIHHLKVVVTDNNGAKAEDNVTVNVGIWVLDRIVINGKFIAKCNKDGNFVKVSSFWHDGRVRFVDYYEYDKKGQEISHAQDVDNDGNIDSNISKVYNKEGKIIEGRRIDFGEIRVDKIIKHIYNENGNIERKVRKSVYIKNEQKTFTSHRLDYKYNEDNQLFEVLKGVDDTRLWVAEKYSYKEGKLVLHESFEEGKKLSGREEYFYEDGHLKEMKKNHLSDDKKLVLLYKNYYNEEELLEKTIWNNNDIVKFFYDDENRLILEESNSQQDEYSYKRHLAKLKK